MAVKNGFENIELMDEPGVCVEAHEGSNNVEMIGIKDIETYGHMTTNIMDKEVENMNNNDEEHEDHMENEVENINDNDEEHEDDDQDEEHDIENIDDGSVVDGTEDRQRGENDKINTDSVDGQSEKDKKQSVENIHKEKFLENVVILKGVSKFYGSDENQVRALDNVNLTIRAGSIIAIMGPSGSGKSTLINMIGSLDVPTHGEVVVDGVNLENMTPRELTRYRCDKVGFVFQSFNLLPNLSALENVELPMEFSSQFREERHGRAEKLLRSVRMSKRSGHFPASLSGGEKQRIAIARALANDPSIILADEPTGNLDSKTGKRIVELLKEISRNRSKTLIIVTHDKSIARMADNIITIRDGKITSVRDVDKENAVKDVDKKLHIGKRLVRILQKEGYVNIEQIMELSEKQLVSIKGLKKKDASTIMNRIRKYKGSGKKEGVEKEPTGENCKHCNKHIPMEGALLCPFCGGRLKD